MARLGMWLDEQSVRQIQADATDSAPVAGRYVPQCWTELLPKPVGNMFGEKMPFNAFLMLFFQRGDASDFR